jgi:hypothetical protein
VEVALAMTVDAGNDESVFAARNPGRFAEYLERFRIGPELRETDWQRAIEIDVVMFAEIDLAVALAVVLPERIPDLFAECDLRGFYQQVDVVADDQQRFAGAPCADGGALQQHDAEIRAAGKLEDRAQALAPTGLLREPLALLQFEADQCLPRNIGAGPGGSLQRNREQRRDALHGGDLEDHGPRKSISQRADPPGNRGGFVVAIHARKEKLRFGGQFGAVQTPALLFILSV